MATGTWDYTDLTTAIQGIVNEQGSGSTNNSDQITGNALRESVEGALTEYSADAPRLVRAYFAGNDTAYYQLSGTGTDLPAGAKAWVAGWSRIADRDNQFGVRHPWDITWGNADVFPGTQRIGDKSWRVEHGAGVLGAAAEEAEDFLVFLDREPASTEYVAIEYTALHLIDGYTPIYGSAETTTTIPDMRFYAFAYLCSAHAAEMLAAFAGHRGAVALNMDITASGPALQAWRDLADRWRRRYKELAGTDHAGPMFAPRIGRRSLLGAM